MEKTYIPKASDIKREWYVIDAEGEVLGRLASKVAAVLIGKHKPTFTPGVEGGDGVIVINAQKIRVTGKKLVEKMYYHHSGYPGGMKSVSLRDQLAKHPDRVIRAAVWGMLPHNKRGKSIIKWLKVYAGAEHKHESQQPKVLA
ncbi:MAG: 50S ribosomal protein L13 [Anaerolineales bacterium]|nr:50S ribosomal protein L13 [Anaerolineales bacterium]